MKSETPDGNKQRREDRSNQRSSFLLSLVIMRGDGGKAIAVRGDRERDETLTRRSRTTDDAGLLTSSSFQRSATLFFSCLSVVIIVSFPHR